MLKASWRGALAVLILLAWLGSAPGGRSEPAFPLAPPVGSPFAAGVVLVKLKPGMALRADRILRAQGHRVEEAVPQIGVKRIFVPPGREMAEIERLRADPAVEYAVRDAEISAAIIPNDAYFTTHQWGMSRINAPAAWDLTTGSNNVIIAVIDSGVDLSHPDLANNIVPGTNIIAPGASPLDDNGHGTGVAGIAAAQGNNGMGVAGVSWNARIMPIKVLDGAGRGMESDLARGIIWAADHGARVINLSLGGPCDVASDGSLERGPAFDAIDYALARGALVVVAAGNSGAAGNPLQCPAAYGPSLAVAATDQNDNRATFSSYGPYVDVAAPGVSILSTAYVATSDLHTYGWASGTSEATPYVSGLAALIWSVDPKLTPQQVGNIIQSTASDVNSALYPGKDAYLGYGRIDAVAAVGVIVPSLQVTPSSLTFLSSASVLASSATTLSPQSLSIALSEGPSLTWQSTANQSWLRLSASSGQTPGTLTVSVDPSQLVSGTTYSGSVRIVTTGAGAGVRNSPVEVPIVFKYLAAPLHRIYLPSITRGSAGGG